MSNAVPALFWWAQFALAGVLLAFVLLGLHGLQRRRSALATRLRWCLFALGVGANLNLFLGLIPSLSGLAVLAVVDVAFFLMRRADPAALLALIEHQPAPRQPAPRQPAR
ncbi:MAG TPA: hypothetical protein VD838_16405 [Anaeromyxobacteraceae bacterium]|nr:hypothetical protein [Anaeromyxobacteraceae bacterium]